MIRQLVIASALLLGLSGIAHAQYAPYDPVDLSSTAPPGAAGALAIASFDPTDATAPISMVEGRGYKVSENTVVHPAFGLSTGFVSNVFYENFNEQPAAVLRLIGQLSVASLSYQRLTPSMDPVAFGQGSTRPSPESDQADQGRFQYWASARLAYDQMYNPNNSTVSGTGGLGGGVLIRSVVNPMGPFGMTLDDNFTRLIRAANYETDSNENRDVNIFRVAGFWHPIGRTVRTYLYYKNTVDAFESSNNQYPDRMDHRVGIHPEWRIFPETKLIGDVSIGYITGIGSAPVSQMKPSSMPLQVSLRMWTLLDMRTEVNAVVGYTNGFYSSGPSYSAPMADLLVAFRYSPVARVGLAYDFVYQDSVNANYFRDHSIRAFWVQDFAPVVAMIQPEVHWREYSGLIVPGATQTRDDMIYAVVAGLHYIYRDWLAATLDYKFSAVQTDFRYMDTMGDTVNPSYVLHELLLGMRLAI